MVFCRCRREKSLAGSCFITIMWQVKYGVADDAYRTNNVSFELDSFTKYEFMVKVTDGDGKRQLVDFKPVFDLA